MLRRLGWVILLCVSCGEGTGTVLRTADGGNPSDAGLIVMDGAQMDAGADLQAGLHTHFPYDQTEGDRATNVASSSAVGCVPQSGQWAPNAGRIDGALVLTSTDTCQNVNTENFFSSNPDWGYALWFKLDPSQPSREEVPLIQFRGTFALLVTRLDAGPAIAVGGGNNEARLTEFPAEGLQTDRWHHVVLNYQRESERLRAYADGKLIGDVFVRLGIPGPGNGRTGGFRGALDDMRIYDHILSDLEIAALAGQP